MQGFKSPKPLTNLNETDLFCEPNQTASQNIPKAHQSSHNVTTMSDAFQDAKEGTFMDYHRNSEIISVKCELDVKNKENHSLLYEIQTLKEQNRKLKEELDMAIKEKIACEKERDSAKTYLSKLPLPQALSNIENELHEKEDECHSLVKLVNHWKAEHAKSIQEIGNFHKKLAERNTQIEELEKINETLKNSLNNSSNVALQQVEELSSSLFMLLEQNEQLTIKVNNYEDFVIPESQKFHKEILECHKKYSHATDELSSCKEELETCKESERQLKIIRAKLEFKESQSEEIIKALRNEKKSNESTIKNLNYENSIYKKQGGFNATLAEKFCTIFLKIDRIEEICKCLNQKSIGQETLVYFFSKKDNLNQKEILRLSDHTNLMSEIVSKTTQLKSIQQLLLMKIGEIQSIGLGQANF